jgi:hypothetical protein
VGRSGGLVGGHGLREAAVVDAPSVAPYAGRTHPLRSTRRRETNGVPVGTLGPD